MNKNPNVLVKFLKGIEPVKVDPYMDILSYFGKDDNPKVDIVIAKLDGPHSNRVN